MFSFEVSCPVSHSQAGAEGTGKDMDDPAGKNQSRRYQPE